MYYYWRLRLIQIREFIFFVNGKDNVDKKTTNFNLPYSCTCIKNFTTINRYLQLNILRQRLITNRKSKICRMWNFLISSFFTVQQKKSTKILKHISNDWPLDISNIYFESCVNGCLHHTTKPAFFKFFHSGACAKVWVLGAKWACQQQREKQAIEF